jgi:glycosyltransferase involved in cell wall biosynthesis
MTTNSSSQREKISVCIATYNGEQYVHEQIASILPQLQEQDEIIVVDDCSKDGTMRELARFEDARMRVLQNENNLGAVCSFERALQMASGELIFLSDQDDVWRTDKIQRVVEAFDSEPSVTLVISAVEPIDSNGDSLAPRAENSSKFRGRVWQTLVKNNYRGCAMAFRRSVADAALPFPANISMHDSWIGLVNTLIGDVRYVHQPLVRYRRHELTVTGRRRLTMKERLAGRWALGSNLIRRARLLRERRQLVAERRVIAIERTKRAEE